MASLGLVDHLVPVNVETLIVLVDFDQFPVIDVPAFVLAQTVRIDMQLDFLALRLTT